MTEKIKLKEEDWRLLFPERFFKIGTITLTLRPLSLAQLNSFKNVLEILLPKFIAEKINLDNYMEPDNLVRTTGLFLDYGVDFLSDIVDLDAEDLVRLPIKVVAELIWELVELNKVDQEGLVKNLQSLGEVIVGIMNGVSGISSNSSSVTDIPLQPSEHTPKDN